MLLPPRCVLGSISRKYAYKIPFIAKINHNELLTPNQSDQVMFGSVEQAWNLGLLAVGATIYFGSAINPPDSGSEPCLCPRP